MHYQRGYPHLRQQVANVDVPSRHHEPGRHLRRGRATAQLVEPVDLFARRTWYEDRGEQLTKNRVVLPPSQQCEIDHRLVATHPVRILTMHPSQGVATIENQL